MTESKDTGETAELRIRAEERLTSGALDSYPPGTALGASAGIEAALHELRVHQIELEMQNEELHRVQVELELSRARFVDLYEFAPVGYVTLDEGGKVVEANLTIVSMLRVDRASLVGQHLGRFVFADDEDVFYRFRRALASEAGARSECEVRLKVAGGEPLWAQLVASKTRTEDDRLAVRLIITDISARVAAEAELEREAKELERVYQLLTIEERLLRQAEAEARLGSWRMEKATGQLNWSEEMYGLFGIDRETFPGKVDEVVAAAVHPDDRAMLEAITAASKSDGQPRAAEYRIVKSDGSTRWIHAAGSQELDERGDVVALVGFAQDVTERKEREELLRVSESRLASLLRQRESDLVTVSRALTSVIDVLGQVVEARDPYTAGHQRRVAELAAAIAQDMGMAEAELEQIRVASLVHDVGKMSVPAEILSKPGTLTCYEYELIKAHAEEGYRAAESAHFEEPIPEIIYQHHERCDGSGYPRQLFADEILPQSKILMVADVVEAMMSHRPYRSALPLSTALEELAAGAGTLYDADVAESCRRVMREGCFRFSESFELPSSAQGETAEVS